MLRQTSAMGEYRFAYKLTGACVTHVDRPGVLQAGPNVPDTDSWENYQAGWRIHGGQVVATAVTDPNGHIDTRHYNATGRLMETADALGNKTVRKYDAYNRVVQETDALGRVTRYGYDTRGNKIYEVDPDNRLTEWDYHLRWNKVTEIRRSLDLNTKVTLARYAYDPNTGNLTSRTDANNRTWTYGYTPRGQLETITDATPNGGKTTRLAYNDAGDLVAVTDPLGHTRRFTPDSLGRTVEVRDALGYGTRFNLDTRGKPTLVTDPTQATVGLGYDVRGNLATVTNPNGELIETNTYDEMDRLTTRTDGAGKTETFGYDAAGNLKTYTDKRNRTTTYTYDESNRLTQVEHPDGTRLTYVYDPVGRLTSLTDASGTVAYQYDNLDRLTQVATPQGTIRYGYDALDRRVRLETPQQVTTYAYDNAGLLRTITQGSEVTALDYDENGHRKRITYPNGIVADSVYDDAGQLISLSYRKDQTVLESLAYAYDPNGNVIGRTRSGAGSQQERPKDAAYDPKTNRLLSLNGETFQYDDTGNLTTRTTACGTTTYTWNVKNELTQIQGFMPDCSALTASFQYDALGRRTQATVNGETTTYLHDGLDVVAEMGTNTATYLRTDNLDEAIARYSSQADRYLLTDLLGSTLTLTDKQGNATTTYVYSPFGETEAQGQPSDNPAQYTQRENDGTGLYYYRARYYAPDLARFITSDPIGLRASLNTYAYVDNNPLRFVDPIGLDKTVTITEGSGGGVYGATVTVDDSNCGCRTFSGRGSSLPNSPVRHNTVAPGTYSGTNTTRASGSPGIYLGQTPTAPRSPRTLATDIFVHCGFTSTNRGSEGCPTVQPDQCVEFFRQFGREEPVTVIIRRTQ